MKPTRLLAFGLPVFGAGLLAAGAVAMTANAATPSPPPSTGSGARAAVCQDFLGHLASQLGVSGDKLNTAAIAAGKQTIQDAVTAGKLSQAQGDKIEARLSASNLCNLKVGDRDRLAGALKLYLGASASALGISDSELTSDLKSGQSLSQVAAAKGVSEADFKTKVVAAIKPQLDALVSSGKLTADQETRVLDKLQNGDPPLWNKVRAGKGGASPTPAGPGV